MKTGGDKPRPYEEKEIREKGGVMAKKPANHGKPWTPGDEAKLEKLAGGNTPTRVIGLQLKRTADAIYSKASELDVSLKPTNQSPYNKQKSK